MVSRWLSVCLSGHTNGHIFVCLFYTIHFIPVGYFLTKKIPNKCLKVGTSVCLSARAQEWAYVVIFLHFYRTVGYLFNI